MSVHEERGVSKRYAADRSGILHLILDADFRNPRAAVYLSACGQRVPAANAEVLNSRTPPGMLCQRCRHAADAVATTA